MPVFNIEAQITLNTWDDIVRRPDYESPVKTRTYRLLCVTAVYSFDAQSACCGAKDCLQAHSRGYLVITSSKKETTLCEACGERLLGVTFEDQDKIFQNQARARAQRIRLNTVLEQSDAVKERVKVLKQPPYGASWLYRSLTNFRKSYPPELLTALGALAVNKEDNAILTALAEEDADPFHMEQVKQLQGVGIFATDIRDVLIGNILKPLKQLEAYAESPDSNPSLAVYCRWADRLDEQFACAEFLVDEGRAFFKRANLERLKSIPLSEKSARRTRSLQWDSDKATARGK